VCVCVCTSLEVTQLSVWDLIPKLTRLVRHRFRHQLGAGATQTAGDNENPMAERLVTITSRASASVLWHSVNGGTGGHDYIAIIDLPDLNAR
jgi:hypothetical protein